ncbi:helix-turn-helix transcriptional regulator [Magnetospirillum fulvum]|uniref:Prophage MuMc02, S24 family peptidase n=1 Tax=Magnetospirillum fulvum MGU-K5 TaxID=1316936 RepID=S9TF86_MAGFU|nr:S24 family peptidase [Magnetospirillum fulvum]EPY00926.1 prophage MuMc02, S24 family peptidase [Magnetospirillum fulvum MGU-K5]
MPVYDMRASAGFGLTTESNPAPLHSNFYRLDWLRRVTAATPDQLAVVRVCGDSMWDTLHDGDHVLVDRTQTSLRKEGLFVLDVEGEVYVKRCSYRPDTRRVTMRSDNSAYPTWDAIDPETVTVIGRVLWLGRHLG